MWSKYMVKGDVQSVTNATIIERGLAMPYGPVVPFNDTLVEVRKVSGSVAEGGAA
jgi:molybdopterin-containing oxidoreductase family molybdopterin binding subunit